MYIGPQLLQERGHRVFSWLPWCSLCGLPTYPVLWKHQIYTSCKFGHLHWQFALTMKNFNSSNSLNSSWMFYHLISLNEYEIPSGPLLEHLEAMSSKVKTSSVVHFFAVGYMLLAPWSASRSLWRYPVPKLPMELPTMTRNTKAPITSVACVMLEYGKQWRFRIKVDVFDFGVFN